MNPETVFRDEDRVSIGNADYRLAAELAEQSGFEVDDYIRALIHEELNKVEAQLMQKPIE